MAARSIVPERIGFKGAMEVTLRNASGGEVLANEVTVTDSFNLDAQFDLTSAAAGCMILK